MNQFRGLFRHLKNGQLYMVEGLARDVRSPSNLVVVYSQQYESKLRGTDINLPIGSLWIRDLNDFKTKFEKVDN